MKNLNEVTLSRVISQLSSKEKAVVIFTGFRAENAPSKNIANNIAAGKELRAAGFGYTFVDGHWIENKGEPDERKVKEDSIFATAPIDRADELISLAHKIANRYNQDAIFAKDQNGPFLMYRDGSKERLTGGLKPGKIGDYYTKLRGRSGGTFLFESARDRYGFFGNWLASLNKGE